MNRASFPPTHGHPAVIKQQYDIHNVWAFENQWHSKLFACKPMGRCCYACFCSCCMGGKLAKYLGESTVVGCCCPCTLGYLRTKLRTARRIKGSCGGDFCAADCCMACTATQMANELESQGMWEIPKPKKNKEVRNGHSNQYNDYN